MNRRHFLQAGVALAAAPLLTAACGSTPTAAPTTAPTENTMPTRSMSTAAESSTSTSGKVLLAYFSRAGENYYYGDRIDLDVGNTQVVAEMIAAAADVDTFRIRAADPYPDDYEQTVARNVREDTDARPAIADPLPDIVQYDTILLGSPVWNVQTPMIMRTFVENLDLSGKTIHPFVTYAVSAMGRVRTDYTDLLPGVTVTEGLAIQGEIAAQARPEVEAWLRELELAAA